MNEIKEEMKAAASRQKKMIRTTAQLPVYRLSANALFILAKLTEKSSRKLVRFTDRVISDCSEICKSIALANELRGEERSYYISIAVANTCVVKSYIVILNKIGVISNNQMEDFNNLIKKITAQLSGWRESINREGH